MRITVLDPTAAPPEADVDPGPEAGALPRCTVGIGYDTAWRSFEWGLAIVGLGS